MGATKSEFEALDAAGAAMENALEELANAIKRVEVELRRRLFKMRTKTPISLVDGDTERHYLLWALHEKNGWSLQVLSRPEQGEEKVTPLPNAPWRLRLRATECFDALLVQAALELRQRNKEVEEATKRCEVFAEKLKAEGVPK